jgi:hypothetical protein
MKSAQKSVARVFAFILLAVTLPVHSIHAAPIIVGWWLEAKGIITVDIDGKDASKPAILHIGHFGTIDECQEMAMKLNNTRGHGVVFFSELGIPSLAGHRVGVSVRGGPGGADGGPFECKGQTLGS